MRRHTTETIGYKITSKLGKLFIRGVEFFISITVREQVYFDNTEFPWINEIEEKYQDIKEEYIGFKKHINKAIDICKVSEEQYKVIDENKWDFIPLYSYGTEITAFTRYFPNTNKNLQQIPNMTTAFFSILKPDTFIKEHRGAYKGYLRYQLGIIIPTPHTQCGIKINDITYHWMEGKTVIFDDTFMHSAWNTSNQERVVLYVDFIRPMYKPLLYISKWLTVRINKSPFIQNALKNLENEIAKQKTDTII